MPKIFPFRATLYNKDKVKDVSSVVTQPYDKIDTSLQEIYYKRNEYNIVRIIKRKDEPDKYNAAGKTFKDWLSGSVLQRDAVPAIYVYHQIYKVGEEIRVRKGLTALVQLEEFGKGKVYPHEETHIGPKIDRFNLMLATGANFGHVFMLYSDKEQFVNKLLDEYSHSEPAFEAKDDFGEVHKVWRITDAQAIKKLQKELDGRDVIIADGHHRYETAIAYRNEMIKRGVKCASSCTETHYNVLVTLINMDSGGLTIFPTHRCIYGLPKFSFADFKTAVARYFTIREYPFEDDESEFRARVEMLEDLHIEGFTKICFGVAVIDIKSYFLLTLKDIKSVSTIIPDRKSDAWKQLDVNVLHSIILERTLSIGKDKLAAEQNVEFIRNADAAIGKVRNGASQLTFLLNPVKIEQIKTVVKNGERFPQKSTDFYPKLLTGLIMNKIDFV